MKKIFVYAMAIASIAAVSCNKIENEAPVTSEGKYSITATIDNSDTKTAYDADGKFSWVAGDKVSVVVYKAESPYTTDKYSFAAEADGNTATFKSVGTPDWTAYPKSGFAIYPNSLTLGGEKDSYTVSLPDNYTLSSGSDFTKIGIPMIGTEESENVFRFKTAVGILKVTLTNVPVSARKLVITTSGDNVSGTFPLNATTAENGLAMADATSAGNSITVNFPQQAAGATVSILVPVPAGKISAGATFAVQQSDGTAIKTTPATVRDITIERNHVLPLPAIAVEDWVSLGTGKFMDDHGFYYLGASGRSADDYASVTIEKHGTEAGRYRISAPYASCPSTATVLPNAADYLYIDTVSGDVVANHSYKFNNGSSIMLDAPYWGYDVLYQNSRIIKYASDGITPANIQLAPYYYAFNGDYTLANCAQNPKIEIVFPGATPMLANAFNYANGATATYDSGSINVNISNSYITAVKVVAAASVADGVTALENGTDIYSFTATDSQTATLSDGDYYLVYKVETDGHGFTYKYSSKFEVTSKTEISLTAGMVSVNTDAGKKDGTSHYDGAGPGALVDNDITTYWHTSYYNGYSGYYEFYDLDPTYGAYIDIDLGASKTVTDFEYRACLRSGAGADFPKHVIVYTSADNSTWNKVGESENVCSGTAAGEWITPIQCSGSAARYIRFSIISNTSNKDLRDPSAQGCTHLAEIKIYE